MFERRPLSDHRRRASRWAVVWACVALVASTVGVAQAAAATTITVTRLTPTPAPSGADIVYDVQLACAAVDDIECTDLTLDVPLPPEIESATFDPHPYLVSSTHTPGVGVSGTLIPSIPAGSSASLTLTMSTANGTTPDGFAWDVDVELTGSNTPTVSASSDGQVTAAADIRIDKYNPGDLPDGERLPLDTTLRYDIDICDPSDPTVPGNLVLVSSDVVDTLPTGAVFEAAAVLDGVPGVYDAGAGTVTWAGLTDQPADHCDDSAPELWVEVSYPSPTFDTSSVVTNVVDIDGAPYGQPAGSVTSSDSRWHRFGDLAGEGLVTKRATTAWFGPNDWIFAGQLLDQLSWNFESYWGIELTNTTGVALPANIVDPMPCGSNDLGPPGAPEFWSGTPGVLCPDPIWQLDAIFPIHPDFEAAVDAGYRPQVVTTAGTVIDLVDGGQNPALLYVPPLPPGELVAEFRMPPSPLLLVPSGGVFNFRLYGHAVADEPAGALPVGAEIWNEMTYELLFNDAPLSTNTATDEMLVVAESAEFHITKTLGRELPSVSGVYSYSIRIRNDSATPQGGAIIADLLPIGFDTASVVLDPADFGTVEIIDDHAGSGRQLVRVTQTPGAEMALGETARATIILDSPKVLDWPFGTTVNEAVVSLAGAELGWCTVGRTNGARSWPDPSPQSQIVDRLPDTNDPLDLDGDGLLVDDSFCTSSREYDRLGGGAVLESEKFVRGDLDIADGDPLMGFPTVASASPGGSGEYRLSLSNEGTVDLENIVVYDVFPHVGDSGVSETQLATARDSDFAVAPTGPLVVPPGATVEYTTSTDPCRAEVSPSNSLPPACVDDWRRRPTRERRPPDSA